jgi:antitoxin component YwqK of YwqJK toxin-antitoxin module
MNMRIILLALNLAFFAVTLSVAQPVSEVRYYDKNWKPCPKKKAVYYRVVQADSSGNSVRAAKDYYINGQLQWEGHVRKDYIYETSILEGMEGLCTWYYPNGKIQATRFYSGGKQEGSYVSFFDNGNKKQELQYIHGLLNGKGTSYYLSGNLYAEYQYVEGKAEGMFVYYFETVDSAGKRLVLEKKNFSHGRLEGERLRFFENGKADLREFYADSLLEGEKTSYYQTGTLREKAHYLKGQLHGSYTYFYPDGTVRQSANYITGKYDGEVKEYFENGQLAGTNYYVNGVPTGEEIEYWASGKVHSRNYRVNGKEDSTWTMYDDTGALISRTVYAMGKLKERENWEHGRRTLTVYSNEKVFNSKVWFTNGALQSEENHSEGGYTKMVYDTMGHLISAKLADSVLVHPVKDNISCLYGFKNYRNEWVLQPQFNFYSERGLFYIVSRNNKYGVINCNGIEIIPVVWEGITFLLSGGDGYDAAGSDNNDYYNPAAGFFRVVRDKKKGVINKEGKIIVPVEYREIDRMTEGAMRIFKDSLTGFADTSGRIVSPRFKFLYDIQNGGYALYSDTLMDHLPIEQRKYGAVNIFGDTLIPCMYSWISGFAMSNLVFVGKGNKIGAYTLQGKMLWEPVYDLPGTNGYNYQFPVFMSGGIALLKKDKKFGLIKSDGTVVVPFTCDSIGMIEYYAQEYPDRAIATINNGGLWSMINNRGETISRQYESLKKMGIRYGKVNGMNYTRIHFLARQKGKYGLINDADSVLVPFEFDYAIENNNRTQLIAFVRHDSISVMDRLYPERQVSTGDFFEGNQSIYAFCLDPEGYSCGAVNRTGKVILQPHNKLIGSESNYLAYVTDSGETAVIDSYGNNVVSPGLFQNILKLDGDRAYVSSAGDKMGIMDLEKKTLLVDTLFDVITGFDDEHGIDWVKAHITVPDSLSDQYSEENERLFNGWQLMDANHHLLSKEEYDCPAYFDEDSLAIVHQNGKKGVLKSNGTVLLPCHYDEIKMQPNGLYLVSDGHWGLANEAGKILVKPQWDDVTSFIGDYVVFDISGKKGIADSNGRILFPPVDDLSMAPRKLSSLFTVKNQDDNYDPSSKAGDSQDTIDIEDYSKVTSFFIAHPGNPARKAVCNHLISRALENYLMSNHTETNAGWNYDIAVYSKKLDQAPDFSSCSENTDISVDVLGITSGTVSYSEFTDHSEGCNHGPGYGSSGKEYYNYGFTTGDSVFPITLDSLFEPSVNYRARLNELLIRKIAKLEDVELNCSDQDHYIDFLEDEFSIRPKGITFYLNPSADGSYYEESNEVELFIPFSSLTTVLRKNGILGGGK